MIVDFQKLIIAIRNMSAKYVRICSCRAKKSRAKIERVKKVNRSKILGLAIIATVIIIALPVAFFVSSPTVSAQQPTKEMDFTVSGTNTCLRFLNDSVSVVYAPFRVAANQNWQLTINCTKMPGGANGYTDMYVYNGYWDNGTNHKCVSADLYPILSNIQSANFELKGPTSYSATYGESIQKSYTIFFVMPPGGPATFHITYKQV
jgi:hypothetical protein